MTWINWVQIGQAVATLLLFPAAKWLFTINATMEELKPLPKLVGDVERRLGDKIHEMDVRLGKLEATHDRK